MMKPKNTQIINTIGQPIN